MVIMNNIFTENNEVLRATLRDTYATFKKQVFVIIK